jgi:hypothetical protein
MPEDASVIPALSTLDQSHIHIEAAVDFAVVVDGNHMRGAQPRRCVRFAAELFLKVLVIREVSGQDFYRDDPVGVGVMGRHTSPMPPRPNNSISR